MKTKVIGMTFGVLLMACGETTVSETKESSPGTSGSSSTYTMNFPQSKLLLGNAHNFLFTLDFSQSSRAYPAPEKTPATVYAPNLIGVHELGAYCRTNGDDDGLPKEKNYTVQLSEGSKEWVDYIELEMSSTLPLKPDGSNPEPETGEKAASELCVGMRESKEVWFWDRNPHKATWNPSTQRYTIRFPVQRGPLTGFKVMSNYGATRFVEKITIATRPQ